MARKVLPPRSCILLGGEHCCHLCSLCMFQMQFLSLIGFTNATTDRAAVRTVSTVSTGGIRPKEDGYPRDIRTAEASRSAGLGSKSRSNAQVPLSLHSHVSLRLQYNRSDMQYLLLHIPQWETHRSWYKSSSSIISQQSATENSHELQGGTTWTDALPFQKYLFEESPLHKQRLGKAKSSRRTFLCCQGLESLEARLVRPR